MKSLTTEADFLRDIKNHAMIVIQDDGIRRHLRFKRPDTTAMYFDLVTWKGHLCYTGDMGTYVFSRIEDMFEFFREYKSSGRLEINPYYWSEKVLAADPDGIEVYSPEVFTDRINEWVDNYINELRDNFDDSDGSEWVETDHIKNLREDVQDNVLSYAHDGEYAALQAAHDYEFEGFQFTDFWETKCHEYSFRFSWCCFAIVWAIRKYDMEKFEGKV